MENDNKNIQIEVKNVLEMIYWLYQKELKAGNINKDNDITSFGKVCKKRVSLKNINESTLFNYDK